MKVSLHAPRSVGVSPAGLGGVPAATPLHLEKSGHRSWFTKAVLLCALIPAIGCTTPGQFRARMEKAARPDEGIQQTQFACIGEIVTKQGTYYVAVQRRILTGMMAPRGIASRLLIFDRQANIVAAYEPLMATPAEPLWCEGSRVYLHGYGSFLVAGTFRPVRTDPRISANRGNFRFGSPYPDSQTGNVLDFNHGPDDPVLTREKRYGSSGGIADDPWELADEDSTPES